VLIVPPVTLQPISHEVREYLIRNIIKLSVALLYVMAAHPRHARHPIIEVNHHIMRGNAPVLIGLLRLVLLEEH